MTWIHPASEAHQRARFMRPDAHRWIRPDAARFLKPGTDPATVYPALASIETKYSPNQPRVPAGNGRESGRWTDGGGGGRDSFDARLASSDKPSLGPAVMRAILVRAAKRLIEAYRSENGLRDLFGRNEGTVAVTTIDGQDIFGSNSRSPTYTSADRREAEKLRDSFIQKYGTDTGESNIGEKPNDAFFHAETNVLVRAARANGGSLAGRSIEVYADRDMCGSCRTVLPYVGMELGNPTVTFIGPNGTSRIISNGSLISRSGN